MAVQMTVEQMQKLQGLNLESDAQVMEALSGGKPGEVAAETVAALGAGDEAGALHLPPVTMGTVMLLEMIESPLLKADAEGMTLRDIAAAVYVLAAGEEAVRPVAGVVRRRVAVERLKALAEKSPEHFAVYLRAVDEIEAAWAEFDCAAAACLARCGHADPGTVAQQIVTALSDAFSGFAALPGGDGDGKKKTAPRGSTMNGPRRS